MTAPPLHRIDLRARHGSGTSGPNVSDRERGAGSVLVLSVIAAVMVALLTASVLASGQSARRQAAAAADLAAIAAATHLTRGGPDPCATAARIAAANSAVIRDCIVDGHEVEVQVRVDVRGAGASWLPPQDRRARAGPG